MRRLLVIGGAVLVLAACDNATAPTLSRHDGPAALAKKTADTSQTRNFDGSCGMWVRVGETDSVQVPCEYW